MRIRQFMTGILGAAIALIILFAAPSAAFAHAGHMDTGAFANQVAAPNSEQKSEVKMTSSVQHVVTLGAASDQVLLPCNGISCCKTASCAGCGILLSAAPPLEPVWIALPHASSEMRAPRGQGPSDLTRPPRPFAHV
jgi:hypothetical protein